MPLLVHTQDLNNGQGPHITTSNPATNQKKWPGIKCPSFTIWEKHIIPFLISCTFLNFTVWDVIQGMDMGGNGINAPVYVGNANAIAQQTEQHIARLAKAAGIVIELIEKGCLLRANLEKATHPFLTSGQLAWNYIVQECTLPLSAVEFLALMGDWVILTMEGVYPSDKFDEDSMRLWIEYVLSFFEGIDPLTPGLPSHQDMEQKIVLGLTPKFGKEKTDLIGATRPQRLIFNQAVQPQGFILGPPMVLPQPGAAAGDWRGDLLHDHLLERWKIAIENGSIHIKKSSKKPNANAAYKGKKPFNKAKAPSSKSKYSGGGDKKGARKTVDKSKAACFRCGGVFHTADQCPTDKKHAPSRKLLVQIKWPAGLLDDFKWPDNFTRVDKPANVNAVEGDDIPDHDQEGEEDDDDEENEEEEEEQESSDSDESGGVGNMVHLSVNDSVRDTAPGKPGLMGRMFRRVGARGAPN